MRRSEWTLFGLLALAVSVAAVAGLRRAPSSDLTDRRLSTELSGPHGAKALRQTLERLGVIVTPLRRALFGLAADTGAANPDDMIALLDVTERPTEAERRALVDHVERGGSLFLAGWNYDVERCFGVRIEWVRGNQFDSLGVVVPDNVRSVPHTRAVLQLGVDAESGEQALFRGEPCAALEPIAVDTLLVADDGRPVAATLRFESRGSVTALGDPAYLMNRTLKETDAGLIVLPWFLETTHARVLVDEYHHGLGHRSSIFGAAFGWLRSSPAGWMLLQLAAAALLVIFAAGVRFGPALEVVDRRRRSAIEHLDALALGLRRAEGRQTAVSLIVGGLRRRLGRRGARPRVDQQSDDWLQALALGARTPEARATVQNLGHVTRERHDDEQVLEVALAVEDVWEALGH